MSADILCMFQAMCQVPRCKDEMHTILSFSNLPLSTRMTSYMIKQTNKEKHSEKERLFPDVPSEAASKNCHVSVDSVGCVGEDMLFEGRKGRSN